MYLGIISFSFANLSCFSEKVSIEMIYIIQTLNKTFASFTAASDKQTIKIRLIQDHKRCIKTTLNLKIYISKVSFNPCGVKASDNI